MAVSFPRADIFTAFPIKTTAFMLDFRESFSRDSGGRTTVIGYRVPIWKAAFTSATMTEDDCLSLEAALMSLDGMGRYFLATDTRRPFPRRMVQGTISGVQMTALSESRNLVTLSGLPAGALLSQGDRFSANIGSLHHLFTLVENATASAGGVVTAVEVRPSVPVTLTVPRAVVLSRPTCTMRIDPGSIAFSPSGALLGTVSFSASQQL